MITIQELLEETQRQNLNSLGYTELQISIALADFRRLTLGDFDVPADQELIEQHDMLRKEVPRFIRSLRKSEGCHLN